MNQGEHLAAADPLLQLLELSRRARLATSLEELAFLAVNDSHAFCAYRQGALWFAHGGVKALSGVVEPEANAPYAQWVDGVCRFLHETHAHATEISAVQLPDTLAEEWADWLPPHGLWLPFDTAGENAGGLLLAADQPWSKLTVPLLQEWMDVWHHAWLARHKPALWSWPRLKQKALAILLVEPELPWWKQRRAKIAGAVLAVLLFPVRLSVLAPGELVPANPAVIRAPVDGVVGQFQVQPNQAVKAGQPLFSFDEASIAARQEVAAQTLASAQAEYRQSAQQAVSDTKSKAQLALLLGKIEEKRAEADFSKDQLDRSRVTAPQDGIALFDDPSEWIGKPVQTGERIMRIAAPNDVEVEAWLPIGDAIPLPDQAGVSLYLAASPLSSLSAQVRYVAHDAVPRPDGTYAYRLRAKLDSATDQRVGQKGTAKINGGWVPLIYWMLRRPLSTIRQAVGI
ncbi:MAG TPA: HlyD family efflux transporter periplasmic adaptor subunit [Rhodocyclaceae bacterium]|nr:HlyD family efflux transporter periplasmic adaptor subunit [Rhodocyclaceae bacterium]